MKPELAPSVDALFPLGIRREEVRGEDAKNGDEEERVHGFGMVNDYGGFSPWRTSSTPSTRTLLRCVEALP